ncbi:MAG: 4-alpha-glucanotransferase [Clostridia bacterium]|nr:4-alpha-glucanotransferase [Clostridia bacterium]
MHVSSLWGDFGCGSFGEEAKRWIDFLSDCGFTYWQTLPFCITDEFNSPYKSYSAFSGNPFFIDLPTLAEKGLLTNEELLSSKQVTPYLCEFDRLGKERITLLTKASARAKNKKKILDFISSRPQLESFCKFMALKEANGDIPWNKWSKTEFNQDTYFAWCFIQYEFFNQWLKIKKYANEKGVYIIGDVPIYVSWESSDVWANPDQFLLNSLNEPAFVAGVPPDYFAVDGQLWGNPIYDWDKMKRDGFSWWKERMRFMAELFDGVRIDHFRGLEAYYSIPAADKTAKNGVWKKGPGMDLINAIMPIVKDKLVIAEDLGDITPEVRKLVKDSTFPGMSILQFGFLGDPNSPHLPHNHKNNLVAYTGTHDNNTLLGFVWEMDEGTRRKFLDYFGVPHSQWNNCYDTVLRSMFASSAGALILPVQDLLLFGSDTRLNKPGCAENNWGFRVLKEQIDSIDKNKFLYWNEIYCRKPSL